MPALEAEEDALGAAAAAAAAGKRRAEGLGNADALRDLCTGKFVLFVEQDGDHNPRLALRVELARGVGAGDELAKRVARVVRDTLLRLSSEYGAYVPVERQLPVVHLHAHGDGRWFPVGVKHKYTL